MEMTPWDWQTLVKTLLTPAQYTVWKQEYADHCQQQAIENLTNQIAISDDMLMGAGAYHTPQLQSCYADHCAYVQIFDLARKAWKKVPDQRGPMRSFSTIQQGATETFLSFVDRLAKAIDMQVDNIEAAAALLCQLVYENANQDCKTILKPHYQKSEVTIADMLKYCQNVGSESHKASLMAAAIVNSP